LRTTCLPDFAALHPGYKRYNDLEAALMARQTTDQKQPIAPLPDCDSAMQQYMMRTPAATERTP